MLNPRKYCCIVKEITGFDGDVYSVKFEFSRFSNSEFKPGQFLHLSLDEYDPFSRYWPESRVFSIASSPNDKHIEIIYSVKGVYTSRMRDELKEGGKVWLKFPYGNFIIDKYISNRERFFMIAGGTGISPFISFLKFKKEKQELYDNIKLFYGIRNKKMFFYEDFLNSIRKDICVDVTIGMMDIDKMTEEINQFKCKCFISGPLDMINLFKKSFMERGFDLTNIIIDEWN